MAFIYRGVKTSTSGTGTGTFSGDATSIRGTPVLVSPEQEKDILVYKDAAWRNTNFIDGNTF